MDTSPATTIAGRDCFLDLTRPCIMGVVNVTPDSFSDGGRYLQADAALRHGLQLEKEGAQILDVGGESTRPGARLVSVAQELQRVIPVIERLRSHTDLPISIDTNKSEVAREAVAAGANFINDISGGSFDPQLLDVAAATKTGLFLMHTRGCPATMQNNTDYQDLVAEVAGALKASVDKALTAGVDDQHIVVDPGIGFGKDVVGNLQLLHHLEQFHGLGYPLLLGTSRKSFLGHILKRDNSLERLSGTLATVALGVSKGVQIFRVHDVSSARDAALVAWAIREQKLP